MIPGLASALGASARYLEFFDSATSTASTITAPNNIAAGDLIVLHDVGLHGSNPPASVVPTDFTSVVNTSDTGTNIRHIVSYKKAVGTEGGSSITGINTTTMRKSMAVFRMNTPITTVTASTWNTHNDAADPTLQSVVASAGAAPLIVFGCYSSSGAISPMTFTPSEDGEVTPNTSHFTKYKIYNASPQDTDVDMDDEGLNAMASGYLSCV